MGVGMLGNIGISFQNSFGTSNVNSFHHLQFLEEDVSLTIAQLVDQSIGRGVLEEGDTEVGMKTVSGNIRIAAQSIPLGVFLQAALGNANTSAVGSVFQHVFEPSQSDFDEYSAGLPFTMLKYTDDNGSASLFYDLNANTLELACTNGEFLSAAIGVVGGQHQQIANVSPTFYTGRRFKWDQTSMTMTGSATNKVQELTISMDQSLEARHTLSSDQNPYPSHIKRTGFRTYEISGTLLFDDQREYQEFLNQTERQLILNFRGDVEVGSGYNEELTIVIPSYRITEFPPNNVLGPVEVSFTSTAKYNTGSGTALSITLQNTQSAYTQA